VAGRAVEEPRVSDDPLLPDDSIRVRGARVHNLRDVDVDLPRDRLVVLTGVSGSGKSSLAFDTVFAEGQRRYVETLSTYARQFLEQLEPPDVDAIEGLPPTVAIDQKAGQPNPRSTVATVTEVHDHLRLLFARAGVPHCPQCREAIRSSTPEQMTETVLGWPEGARVVVLAPLVRGRKGEHQEAFATIRRAGLLRARIDGATVDIVESPPKLARTSSHDIEAVVDRLVLREGIRPRLAESIDRALKLGDGSVIFSVQQADGAWTDRVLSVRLACPRCGLGLEPVEPRLFSFNSPAGACPTCDGLGTFEEFDPELVVPDRGKSLTGGAVAPWNALGAAERAGQVGGEELWVFLKAGGVSADVPLSTWPRKIFDGFLFGDGASGWPGLLARLREQHGRARGEKAIQALEAFRVAVKCPDCDGTRLRPAARAVTLGDWSIDRLLALPIGQARDALEGLAFEPPLDRVGPPLVAEIARRLAYLERVGLHYLTLERGAATLSGGELQRVRLATQIGSGLTGVCFILDEPTAGLHPLDTERLLAALADLRDAGNSVLVVEHDEAVVRAADWVVDLGPAAGPDGGRVVAQGAPGGLEGAESVTARWLAGQLSPPEATGARRLERSPGALRVVGASERNLRSIDATLPLGCLVAVTGVSGSGKSTLVQDVLGRAVRRGLLGAGPRPGAHKRIEGLEAVDKLIDVDQSPIGRTPRSSPATYTGLYDEIRVVFASTREAKIRGYKPNRFSFNVQGGRCEECQGQGVRRVEMQFLPDLVIRCEACDGRRFNAATLEVRYKGKDIAQVLDLRVDEAMEFFDAIPRVRKSLEALHEAGLGYVTLGQSSTTLSGGESQRVKLAAELGRASTGRTLYLLDEPTTGLHAADVANLIRLLGRLADLGNTVVVIEHNLDLIRVSDWVVDLGPGGGKDGGRLVVEGPPTAVSRAAKSQTGRFLKPLIEPGAGKRGRRRA
jgi:excinuclease ABC subunit A